MTNYTPHRNMHERRTLDKESGAGREPVQSTDARELYEDDEFERGILGPQDFVDDLHYAANNERTESEFDTRGTGTGDKSGPM